MCRIVSSTKYKRKSNKVSPSSIHYDKKLIIIIKSFLGFFLMKRTFIAYFKFYDISRMIIKKIITKVFIVKWKSRNDHLCTLSYKLNGVTFKIKKHGENGNNNGTIQHSIHLHLQVNIWNTNDINRIEIRIIRTSFFVFLHHYSDLQLFIIFLIYLIFQQWY